MKARETRSFALKREANLRLIESKKEFDEQESRESQARAAKLRELSRRIQMQMVQLYSTTDQNHVQRAHDFANYQHELTREYKKQLEEMYDRLEKRPFLFERIALDNAKQSAGKQFDEQLQNASE